MKRFALLGKKPFQFTIVGALLFLVFTIVGMFTYAGGTHSNPDSPGYSFFRNFFSSLGMTVAPNGESNTVSLVLFILAMFCAGLALIVYFIVEPKFFWDSLPLKMLSSLGSIFGVIAGAFFIGVAFPGDLYPDLHGFFTLNAFRTFLIAVIFYLIAILINRRYPKRYAIVYAAFAVMLFVYILLMMYGPGFDDPNGEVIQATSQKLIVYAAIICMMIQAYGSMKLVEAS